MCKVQSHVGAYFFVYGLFIAVLQCFAWFCWDVRIGVTLAVQDIVDLRKFTADEFSQLHAVLMDLCKFLSGGCPQRPRVGKSRVTQVMSP